MNLPNFIVIGAPRSGTTSLYFYLKQHPEIYLPVRKELHYFSYDLIAQNIAGPGDKDTLKMLCADQISYLEHYKGVQHEHAIGEISPSYLYYAQVGQRIRQELGPIKIIAILRNPIEKAFSQYMHLVRLNLEKLDFHEALMAEEKRKQQGWGDIWRYAESSLYAKKLNQYLTIFGTDNVHVLLMDNFVKNTSETLKEIFEFLNIDTHFQPEVGKVYNKSGFPRSQLLARFFAYQNPLKSTLKKLIPERVRIPLRMAILEANNKENKFTQIDIKAVTYLTDYFHEDIEMLEKTLSKSTSWLN